MVILLKKVPFYKSKLLIDNRISQNSKELLRVNEMNDLTLEIEDTMDENNKKCISVNSAILAARSKFFKEKLQNLNSEKRLLTFLSHIYFSKYNNNCFCS